MRKVPNAVAAKGNTNAALELTQPSSRIVCTLARRVTSSGSSSVAMKKANTRVLNGNRRKAKA